MYRGRVGSGHRPAPRPGCCRSCWRRSAPRAARSPTRCRASTRRHDVGRAGRRGRHRHPRARLRSPAPAVVPGRPLRPDPGGPHVKPIAPSSPDRARRRPRTLLAAPPAACPRRPRADRAGRTARRPVTPRRRQGDASGSSTRQVRHRQPHRRLARPGDVLGQRADGEWRSGSRHRRPGRLQRAGPAPPAGAGLGQDPARHLPAAVGVRHAPRSATAGTRATARSAAATTGSSTTSRATTTATATSEQGGFRWRLGPSHPDASERLKDYPEPVRVGGRHQLQQPPGRHRGGAIFVHVNGSGATAGCVSAPRWFMQQADVPPRPDRAPVIAVGR